MARIVLLMDLDLGHLYPSFPLANALKEAGHEVIYWSFIDSEEIIKDEGFARVPLFPKHY